MTGVSTFGDAILEAIEDPAIVIARERTIAANRAARALLGAAIIGRDVRFAIRHPVALDTILGLRDAAIDLVGIGSADRPWKLTVRAIGPDTVLARLSDRSAMAVAERMRTDFVANASHELRTPLATIIGYAETLAEDDGVDNGLRKRFVGTIHDEARRMLRIVEDLMSLSRIEAGRFDVPDELIDLSEVARLAIDHSGHLADQRGCTIQLDPGPPVAVRGDFGQLLQLTDNLIANALRYGCTSDSCVVEVGVRSDGRHGLLVVRDQGDGIPPEHLPRLTERFYRVDAARSRDAGGTGLGLAIVKHIVERHRGTLGFDSRPGRGTAVTVMLPLADRAVIKV